MSLQISGKNIDIGSALRVHVETRIGDAVEKYFDGGFTGHVTVEREGSGFKSDCMLHLDTGIALQAHGQSQDVYKSFDIAAEHIEKRLRRYKRRLKEHHVHKHAAEEAARYVIAALDEEEEVAADYSPTIIAEETTNLATMTVGSAVMAMDLANEPVFVFRNAAHGGVNVVYRRPDGHIGWVDPSLSTAGSKTDN